LKKQMKNPGQKGKGKEELTFKKGTKRKLIRLADMGIYNRKFLRAAGRQGTPPSSPNEKRRKTKRTQTPEVEKRRRY